MRDRDDSDASRRNFLKTVGLGSAALASAGAGQGRAELAAVEPEKLQKILLSINGRQLSVLVEARWTLLFVLREQLGLTGTKVGCERGECGACTVLLDGVPRYACLTLAVEAVGHEVTTLEGLLDGEDLGPVQRAFVENDAYQCGYCTPGQVMAAEGLLRENPAPDLEQIRVGVSGNLCRCGAYANIFRAVADAAKLRRGGGA
ncbi:2Fe-2S iron-sulfur cluster binding domain-containing protein [bacterium]|nr:2Fe-2S iron-sulfur cluster binding domain-containing protein [bacterium]